MARSRSGRSRVARWAASTAGTTSAARASKAGTVRPVRCRNTDGCVFRESSRAIIAAACRVTEIQAVRLRRHRYREEGLVGAARLVGVERGGDVRVVEAGGGANL